VNSIDANLNDIKAISIT